MINLILTSNTSVISFKMTSTSVQIIDVQYEYIRQCKIGLFAICTIPVNIEPLQFETIIYLKTKYNRWLLLKNHKVYNIEVEKQMLKVWICKVIDIPDTLVSPESNEDIPQVNIIYGRCINSMTFLDKVYRDYVYRHKFKKDDILAIKSVAGSGKTTTLLNLAKQHSNKKILYIAFNKSLILDIRTKLIDQNIKNLYPTTFDALTRDVFINKTGIEPDIMDLKPQTLPNIIDWFKNKPFKIKNYYVSNYAKFCNQTMYNDIKSFSVNMLGGEKKLLNMMWDLSLINEFLTFDTIRKLVEINNWCKGYIDNKYDMIFIDESQDFDNIMLKILLEDTTIPKIFVGDPRQAIYEWRGCINAFDKLPERTLTVEFYSTFRIGEPACESIRSKFDNCWMISKSVNNTVLRYDIVPTEKYVYLFRSWKNLLQTAQKTKNIWIYNYDSQVEYIKRLHNKLQIGKMDEEELNDFSDDLPKFLLKLSLEDLEKLINSIQENLVKKEDSMVDLYTIHSYKGLESNIIRIYNDIDIKNEHNIYYVALTRGKKEIILDTMVIHYETEVATKKQTNIMKYGFKKKSMGKSIILL